MLTYQQALVALKKIDSTTIKNEAQKQENLTIKDVQQQSIASTIES